MKFELRPFQEDAVVGLLDYLKRAKDAYRAAQVETAVGLTATTGAGKTVIAAALIEAILHGSDDYAVDADPGAVFLWLTDMPELNLQTRDKMLDAASELRRSRLEVIETTFAQPSLSAGHVYFLNTQKLSKRTDLVKAGPLVGRNFTFWDIMRTTIEDPERTLYVVIDEAHRGMVEAGDVEEANSIVQRFLKGYPEGDMPAAPIVLGISATPARFEAVVSGSPRARFAHDVPAEEVRASGLIKDKILAEYVGGAGSDAMALFPEAVDAWWQATLGWATYHAEHPEEPLVVPALVVQVENEGGGRVTQTDLDELIRQVVAKAGPLEESAFAHSFSGSKVPEAVGGRSVRYIDPPSIAGDTDAKVIFFKTSLGTGWDCPRAEVLFSFRRAVDPTSIAQVIGRMVRTPLTRRIAENAELNAAAVFLPHYDGHAVEAIVAALHAAGSGAVADTITRRRESVTLPLRTDMADIVAAVNTVPSMLVPTSRARAYVRVLADLANFIAKSGLDADAYTREMGDCAGVLVARREALADDEAFAAELAEQATITFHQAEVVTGETTVTTTGTNTVPASEESLGRAFAIAERKVTGEVAKTYVRQRLAAEPGSLTLARREAYALASRPAVVEALNAHASDRIDELRQTHGAAIGGLAAASQARYRAIVRQAPDPSPDVVKLPDTASFPRGETVYERHLYADEAGGAPLHFVSSWETDTITTELALPDSVAWLRNIDRAEGALTLARSEGNRAKPFYPDFLFVRETEAGYAVDIVDPHDHTKPDAISKAKGLSDYARRNAESIVAHVDIVAKIGGTYRRLHLEREAIRTQVDALGTNTDELASLYTRAG